MWNVCIFNFHCVDWKFVFFRKFAQQQEHANLPLFLFPSILKTFVVSISFAFDCVDDLIQQKRNWHFVRSFESSANMELNWKHMIYLCNPPDNVFSYSCLVSRQLFIPYSISLHQHLKWIFRSNALSLFTGFSRQIQSSASPTPWQMSIFIRNQKLLFWIRTNKWKVSFQHRERQRRLRIFSCQPNVPWCSTLHAFYHIYQF